MNNEMSNEAKLDTANSRMLYEIMQEILRRENYLFGKKERCWVCSIGANNKIQHIEMIRVEETENGKIEAVHVYRLALQKESVQVIMISNHADESIEATEAEKDLTAQMIQAGRIVNIEFSDHLVINENEYYSFKDSGLLEELKASKKWLLKFEEEQDSGAE